MNVEVDRCCLEPEPHFNFPDYWFRKALFENKLR